MSNSGEQPRIALVTGVGRRAGIGAAIVEHLLRDGYDVAATAWAPYDDKMPWGADGATHSHLAASAAALGSRLTYISADLEQPSSVEPLFDAVESTLGPVRALVLNHCESVDSGLLDTSIESFDRHFAVNARASWLLIREFARRFSSPHGSGRIVAMTSDAVFANVPYGASKGALDRIVQAASLELADLGVSSNLINPGPIDTGWMDSDLRDALVRRTPLGRLGTADDAANLVSFLCSERGGWINGQLLHSNGGFQSR
jgi:3-oxoacyl-[acyl-carrier protein] reductase